MIFMNLKLNNILSFNNFNINFSYPKKLTKSTIKAEYLENIKSFRYKKVNIFVGANATGKTSLIKVIWVLSMFFHYKDTKILYDISNKLFNESYIEMDIVDKSENQEYFLYRIKLKIDNKKNNNVLIGSNKILLKDGDSYESTVKEISSLEYNFENHIDWFNKNNIKTKWHTFLPATETGFDQANFMNFSNNTEFNNYLNILQTVFRTLDKSIINVNSLSNVKNAYVIEFENKEKIIIQTGYSLSLIPHLSSGTKHAINIANLIFSVKYHKNQIYLIDEQFAYLNSDVEVAVLNTIVSLLGDDEQLFFTTHNKEILEIKFPFHSFYFLKKENIDGSVKITSLCASLIENRNNVSAKTILDNDMLSTTPDLSKIYNLGE